MGDAYIHVRKESLVHRNEIARFYDADRIHQKINSRQIISNTHGAKSSIAESAAAGGRQSKDKGYDGGANHIFRCLLAFAIEIMSEEGLVSSTAETKDREKQGGHK